MAARVILGARVIDTSVTVILLFVIAYFYRVNVIGPHVTLRNVWLNGTSLATLSVK